MKVRTLYSIRQLDQPPRLNPLGLSTNFVCTTLAALDLEKYDLVRTVVIDLLVAPTTLHCLYASFFGRDKQLEAMEICPEEDGIALSDRIRRVDSRAIFSRKMRLAFFVVAMLLPAQSDIVPLLLFSIFIMPINKSALMASSHPSVCIKSNSFFKFFASAGLKFPHHVITNTPNNDTNSPFFVTTHAAALFDLFIVYQSCH
eukprot:265497-Ditylum_brightwellii.AAC.1